MLLDETKRALIVVRTYPVPVPSGIESSCTAAVTEQGEWLRLFPVPWRLLPNDQRFRKYQWVELKVKKADDDPRRESYHLKQDGIRILSEPLTTEKAWSSRKSVVLPVAAHCLCCLTKLRNEQQFPTLGVFRPAAITRLRITPDSAEWTPGQAAMLRQGHLFVEPPGQELEKIPFFFRYEFRCAEDDCPGHSCMCTDWEMGESYRQWKQRYGDKWEEKFRLRYEEEMINRYDTYFYVGTVATHPNRWIIIGLFYPPHEVVSAQAELF